VQLREVQTILGGGASYAFVRRISMVREAAIKEETMKKKKAKLSKGKKLEAQKPLRDMNTIPGTKNIDVGSAK
jgi:hypothetical protein